MPAVAYGKWETRTITVNGWGNKLPWTGTIEASPLGVFHLNTPGSQPWRSRDFRLGTWRQAINSTFADRNPSSGSTTVDASGGADFRYTSASTTIGAEVFSYTDRVAFGTYYDSYNVQVYLGRIKASVQEWLRILVTDKPISTASTSALSVAEWHALFGDDPTTPSTYRQFDVPQCSLTLHTAITSAPARTGAPGASVRMRQDTLDTYPYDWLTGDTLRSLPIKGFLSDGTHEITTKIDETMYNNDLAPTPATVWDYQLALTSTNDCWRIIPGIVDRPDPTHQLWSYRLDVPQWDAYKDPGYYDDAPVVDGTNQRGGVGNSWVSNVTLALSATITVRMRFGTTSTIPLSLDDLGNQPRVHFSNAGGIF